MTPRARGGSRRERGEHTFLTERHPALTGHLVDEFCKAAIQRSSSRRVAGLREYFESFTKPHIRSRVAADELMASLGILHLNDPGSRLREITKRAREVSWELANEPNPGQSVPPNPHLLMPTILTDDVGAASASAIREKRVELQRISKYRGLPVSDHFRPIYQPELERLDRKRRQFGLTTAEYAQYGFLRIWADSVSGSRDLGLRPGDVLCGYRLGQELKITPYRAIYLATSILSGDKVVLKTLTPLGATIDRERRSFERSAELHEKLKHASVPEICLNLVESAGHLLYAVRYVDGVPLFELTGLSTSKSKQLLVNTAKILGQFHSENIVHGDVSPQNIVIRPDGYPAFIDFECSGQVETSDLSRVFTRGTDRYLSIERRSNPLRLEPTDDVFSFGVLACELLGNGQLTPELVLAALRGSTETASLAEVLQRCLCGEAGGRYKSGVELSFALSTALDASKNSFGRPMVAALSTKKVFGGESIADQDFSHQDLRGCDFTGAVISNCNFTCALLTNATFQGTRFRNVRFNGAYVILSRFQGATFGDDVDFTGANLERTVWDGAETTGGTDFSWANFWGAFLRGFTGFEKCRFDRTNFSREELGDDQRAEIMARWTVLNATNYGDLANLWRREKRGELVWWLAEASSPGGLVALY